MIAIYTRTATHDTEAVQRQISKCMDEVGATIYFLLTEKDPELPSHFYNFRRN